MRIPNLTKTASAFVLGMGALFQTAAVAATEEGSDQWQFEFTPYLFAAGLDGTTGVGGVTADVDASFSDILENLDSAFMMLFTAQNEDWVFNADGIYFRLKDEKASSWQGPLGNTSTADLNADLTQRVYSLSAGYAIQNDTTRVDLLGVARYTSLSTSLGLAVTTGPDLLPDGSRSVGGKEEWWDAAVGVRAVHPVSKSWDLLGYADIGAGGSDLTYQLLAGANWQFSQTFSAKLGYRYFYQDYESNDFKWDMTTSGLFAGLGIRF